MHDLGSKTMVQRAVALSSGHASPRLDGTQNIASGMLHRLCQIKPKRPVTGNRRRQGAAGAMHILAADALAAQEKLARSQIWSRVFAKEPAWLRLGLPGSEAEWTRLAEALAR